MYVYYRPTLEAVVGGKELKSLHRRDHFTSLSMTLPMKGYSIVDFLGQVVRPDKLKDECEWTNKCKWSVSIS